MKQVSSVSGPRLKRSADSLGFAGNDAKSIATIMSALLIVGGGPTHKFEIEEATAEKARLKCINCAYWDAMQAQKITEDICSAGSHYQADAFAKAMNPNMTSTLVKARPRGDSVCEWVFELKA